MHRNGHVSCARRGRRHNMQRVLTRKISLPQLEVNVNDALQEEKLIRARDYVLRTAIPALDDYIIAPFSGALKESMRVQATNNFGVNERGILNGAVEQRLEFGKIAFAVSAGPSVSVAYEQVIADMRQILRTAHGRKSKGVEHAGVHSLRAEFQESADNNSTAYNRLDARLELAPETNAKSLLLKLDKVQYGVASEKNAIEYVQAKSLRANLAEFVSQVERELNTKYCGEETREVNQELQDESAVRYLFFPKTTTEYAEVYRGLVGQKTGKPSSSTGDLDILDQLAFQKDYNYAQGKLSVATAKKHGTGTTTIIRHVKGGDDVREYRVVKHCGVHVAIEDVAKTLEQLCKAKSTTATQLKVDFFPAYK